MCRFAFSKGFPLSPWNTSKKDVMQRNAVSLTLRIVFIILSRHFLFSVFICSCLYIEYESNDDYDTLTYKPSSCGSGKAMKWHRP